VIPSGLPQRCTPDAADGITPFFMDGDARSKVGYGKETGEKYPQFEVYRPCTIAELSRPVSTLFLGGKKSEILQVPQFLPPVEFVASAAMLLTGELEGSGGWGG
jgi:hypothetical protein